MFYNQLSKRLQRRADRNRKAYNKKYGTDPERGTLKQNLVGQFIFDETPEGELFWRIVCYCDNMPHLEIMPEYGRFLKKRRQKIYWNVTFVLSLCLYVWAFYKLALYFAPNEAIRNFLLFR